MQRAESDLKLEIFHHVLHGAMPPIAFRFQVFDIGRALSGTCTWYVAVSGETLHKLTSCYGQAGNTYLIMLKIDIHEVMLSTNFRR